MQVGDFQDALNASVIAGVNIKCPSFWKINPQLWFAQVEAQFSVASKYETVKNKLIERFSDSDDKKMNILFNDCTLLGGLKR